MRPLDRSTPPRASGPPMRAVSHTRRHTGSFQSRPGGTMSEPTSESESTRHLAEQRLPESHFQTPTWLGPDRHPDGSRPTIPEQATPTHDDAVPPPKVLLETAHWVGSTTGRTA